MFQYAKTLENGQHLLSLAGKTISTHKYLNILEKSFACLNKEQKDCTAQPYISQGKTYCSLSLYNPIIIISYGLKSVVERETKSKRERGRAELI